MKTYFLNNDKIDGTIEDFDALKQSIKIALDTAIGECEIFSWNFGNDLLNILDQPIEILQAKSEEYIKKCLMFDDRIIDVNDFGFTLVDDSLYINFNVETIYGDTESEVVI